MVIHNALKKSYINILWLVAIYFNWISVAWNIAKDFTAWPEFVDPTIERNVWFAMICYAAYIIVHLPLLIHLVEVEIKYGFYHCEETSYLVHHLTHGIKRLIPVGLCAGATTWALMKLSSKSQQEQMIVFGSMSFVFFVLYPTIEMWALLRNEANTFDVSAENPELKRSIDALCDRVQFPKEHVSFLHSRSRSMHSSAFFYGFFTYRKVVIFARLIEGHSRSSPEKGLPNRQIEAVVSHELGHWKNLHSEKGLIFWHFMQISTALLVLWLRSKDIICQAFGFTSDPLNDGTIIDDRGKEYLPGMVIGYYLILRTYHNFLQTLHQIQQREYEINADEHASELGYGTPLEQALIKIVIDHEAFPSADQLYSLFHHNHPCLLQRLQKLQEHHEHHHHHQNSQNHHHHHYQDKNNNSNGNRH
ncbi:CAAX prenyl protease 1 [Orchesella cincta]|uniref:CAAX prenyl protease 1 n=1 Tax=Orchesella cincta TaxID=48709 RepID=A0A1D2MQG4_ORCCI|nr:CAAX prenyl protease 1 [Orchesella cincta]